MPGNELPPIVAGDSYPLVFTFTDEETGAPIAQAGNSIRLTVKRMKNAAEALLERTVNASEPDAAAGIIRAPITDEETLAWRGMGAVFLQAQHEAAGVKRSPLLSYILITDPA